MELTGHEKQTIKTYDDNAVQWSALCTYNFLEQEMKRFQEFLPHGRILEIGTGSGRDASELIELGYDYIGTDISAGLIKEAKKNFPNIPILHQSVYDLVFPKKTMFDGFWASAVLLHIPKQKINAALQSIRKYIRHDGIGFIALKQGEGEKMVDNGIGKRFFAYYSIVEFSNVLTQNDYEVLETGTRTDPKTGTTWIHFFVRVKK